MQSLFPFINEKNYKTTSTVNNNTLVDVFNFDLNNVKLRVGGERMDYKAVGEAIRKKRSILGYSQAQAAASSKVSLNHYAAIERGEKKGSLETFYKIALGLDMSLDTLLADVYLPGSEAFISSILFELRQLPPVHRRLVQDFIHLLKQYPNLEQGDK